MSKRRDGKYSSASRQKPNVIFILVDDLGYADIGYQNQEVLRQMRDLLRSWEADTDRTKPTFNVK